MTPEAFSNLSREQQDRVLADALASSTYDEVSQRFGVSRGRIYGAACRLGARKTEERLQEKKAERRKRRQAFMQEVINAVSTSDVLDYLDGIEDDSVDLHFTSPPYNIGRSYGGGGGDASRFHYYLGWLLQVLSEMDRTLRPGGVLGLQVGATAWPTGMKRC